MLPAICFPVTALIYLPLDASLALLNVRSRSFSRHIPGTLAYDYGPVCIPEQYNERRPGELSYRPDIRKLPLLVGFKQKGVLFSFSALT
ncbi:hypothetical protein F4814DRAFT_138767 [Daldinia grandis]|nr:hypothetical protein F4814DRAFT_138767 [Daldinia grandis]